MDVMKIYDRLPVPAQDLACSLKGAQIRRNRYGRAFSYYLQQYEERGSWSYDRLCEYRDRRLRRLMKHCYDTVPYYRKMFDSLGIDYRQIRRLEDLQRLPVLDKQTVNENYQDFITTAKPRSKIITSHTSGTTGSGFVFCTTHNVLSEQWAVWWRYRKKLGISFDTWCALFGSKGIVPVERKKPPFSRFNLPCRQEYFSSFHMNDTNIRWYAEEIIRRKHTWIHGYPSAVNLLADYILAHDDLQIRDVRYVTTGAENLLPVQRERIRQAFGVEPRSHYGLAEGVANFSEDPDGAMFVDEDFAAVELLDIPGQKGKEIVGTSLSNYVMPLIRYRTHDIAEYRVTDRGRQILSLDGRQEDYVTLPDGCLLGSLDQIFRDMLHIKEAQIRQKDLRHIELHVVQGDHYTKDDEEQLLREAKLWLIGMEIRIVYTDKIPRTQNGKLRFVVSEL